MQNYKSNVLIFFFLYLICILASSLFPGAWTRANNWNVDSKSEAGVELKSER